MSYIPNPVNLSDVQLPDTINALAEELAKNTHEAWAETRMRSGWKYGTERNDAKKETPCLVEFEKLSDEEKEIDYCTALNAVKFIISKGYSIVKSDNAPASISDEQKREKMDKYYNKIKGLIAKETETDKNGCLINSDNRLRYIKDLFEKFAAEETGKEDSAELQKEYNEILTALHTFINAETYSNASKVYEAFFKLFPDSDKLSEYLHTMHLFEENVATLNNKQRDHFVHSVNVFILGLSIYGENSVMREYINKDIMKRAETTTPSDLHIFFLKSWGISSLMHDIGYPVEIVQNNIQEYFQYLNQNVKAENHDINPFIQFGHFDRLNSISVASGEYKADNSIFMAPIDLISNRLCQVYSMKCNGSECMTLADMKNHLDSYLSYMQTNKFVDHGFFSAITVLRQFSYMADIGDVKKWETYLDIVVEAATAIFLHNSWRYIHFLQKSGKFYNKNYIKKDNSVPALSIEQFPMGYLTILCDELQDWNRTAYGKKDKVRVNLAEAAGDFYIDDNKINITYYVKNMVIEKGQTVEDIKAQFRKKKYNDISGIININEIFKEADISNFLSTEEIIDIYHRPLSVRLERLRSEGLFASDEVYNKIIENLRTNIDKAAQIIARNYNDVNVRLGYGVDYPEWNLTPLSLQLSNIRQASQVFDRLHQSGRVIDFERDKKESDAFTKEELDMLSRIEHDEWSKERVAAGWTPALKKNVLNKETNCFLEYDDLSETVQYYDTAAVCNSIEILEDLFGLRAYKK